MLKADGSLNLGTGWSGSLDPSSWTMTTDANGAPRFVRAPEGGQTTTARTTLAAVPGDDKWDDRFGLPGVAYSGVYALAVSENDVYVGGYALAVAGNIVYAGGDFATAGTATVNSLAKWNGSTWQAVGGGVWSGSYRGTVRALVMGNGNLFVGRTFIRAGTVKPTALRNGTTAGAPLGVASVVTIATIKASRVARFTPLK
jgi:hypothetical protein